MEDDSLSPDGLKPMSQTRAPRLLLSCGPKGEAVRFANAQLRRKLRAEDGAPELLLVYMAL
jgi:hypothetical protein